MGFATGIGSLVLLAFTAASVSLATPAQTSSPVVDLGYATYEGYYNDTYDLNVFKGWVLDKTDSADRDFTHASYLGFGMRPLQLESCDGKLHRPLQ